VVAIKSRFILTENTDEFVRSFRKDKACMVTMKETERQWIALGCAAAKIGARKERGGQRGLVNQTHCRTRTRRLPDGDAQS